MLTIISSVSYASPVPAIPFKAAICTEETDELFHTNGHRTLQVRLLGSDANGTLYSVILSDPRGSYPEDRLFLDRVGAQNPEYRLRSANTHYDFTFNPATSSADASGEESHDFFS